MQKTNKKTIIGSAILASKNKLSRQNGQNSTVATASKPNKGRAFYRFAMLLVALMILASPLSPFGLTRAVAAQGKAPIWLDVRTPQEYDAGHLKGAVLVPYNQVSQKISSVTRDKKQPLNLYCSSNRCAEIALQTLEKMGFTNVQNMGSYKQLKAQGLE